MADSASNPGVLVIVPAYNEAEVIRSVIERIRRNWSVLVIDDGSADATADEARAAGAIVLRHCVNRGQGAALQTGIEYARRAGYDSVVTFDADGQHDADDIARLVAPIRAGRADVAMGSRFLGAASDIPAGRKILLRGAILFTWAMSGVRLTDAHNGLRAFGPRAMKEIELTQDGMAHASEVIDQILKAELRVEEVPVAVRYTSYSLGKGQRKRDALRTAMDYLLGRLFG